MTTWPASTVAATSLSEKFLPESHRLVQIRNQLHWLLSQAVPEMQLCGPALEGVYTLDRPLRLPGNLDVAFGNVDGEALLLNMPGIAVSSGAACSSTDPGPSHVLLALGLSEDLARSTLRFGLGRFNSEEDVKVAAADVAAAVEKLRQMA
jgi:cysteine desulfurase